MGLLATAMGLSEGKEGMKELTKRMKDGKIGMDELFKFLDMAAGRAKSTGAYDLAINSKQAYETRMSNSYKEFSLAFGKMYDSNIKNVFQGITSTLEDLTGAIKSSEEQQKKTGIFGWNKDLLDTLTETVMKLGEVLEQSAEGWWNLYARITNQPAGSTMKTWIADREMERNYFKSMGITSEQAKDVVRRNGMPGYQQFVEKNALNLGASKANAWLTSVDYAERAGLISKTTKKPSEDMAWWQRQLYGGVIDAFGSKTVTNYPRNAPVQIAPTYYFTIQNNDEANDIIRKSMAELVVPFK